MAKKSKSVSTDSPASLVGESSRASQVRVSSPKSIGKANARAEAAQGPKSPKTTKQAKASQSPIKHAKASGASAGVRKTSQAQQKSKQMESIPAAAISKKVAQSPTQNLKLPSSSNQKSNSSNVQENPDIANSKPMTVNEEACVRGPTALPESDTPSSSTHLDALHQPPEAQSSPNSSDDPTTNNNLKHETFQLATATLIPISTTVERKFYESQLLLYVLEKVRGDHTKRQNYHGELDQDETELRRSFTDKLAYICDFKKGGSTVTALALQKTYQGVIFWLAANETIKPKVTRFLREVLQMVKKVEAGASIKTTEAQLLALIVTFNKERLDYYWSALSNNLQLCIQYLETLENTTNGKPKLKDLNVLKRFLGSLPKLSSKRVELVKECFEARRISVFETLAQLTASGRAHSKFFDGIRHLLGRLGEHLKAAKTIVSAAVRFPAMLDEFEIQAQVSPPSSCYFQSPNTITLYGMASRIFTNEDEIAHYQQALETLERTSNGALLGRLQQECCFKTRVHAELLLTDLFYWRQFDFYDDDPYIGCSKPACFNCFQYILAHPGNFVLPACHNKLYLAWRTPDILFENVPISTAIKIREAITSKINSSVRAELRRQIDGRYARKAAQYDSVTGTSSSIQGGVTGVLEPANSEWEDGTNSEYASAQEDQPDRQDSPNQWLSGDSSKTDDSDDDLNWYQSRVQRVTTRLTTH